MQPLPSSVRGIEPLPDPENHFLIEVGFVEFHPGGTNGGVHNVKEVAEYTSIPNTFRSDQVSFDEEKGVYWTLISGYIEGWMVVFYWKIPQE